MASRIALASLLLAAFILSGALGLKMPGECDGLSRVGGGMECLHTAAVSQAYLGNEGEARDTCYDIYYRYGVPGGYADDDASKKAELETNNCFYDIARILGEPSICDSISDPQGSVATGLSGAQTNVLMCKDAAGKAAKLKPENYWTSDTYQNSLCSLIYILPALLLGAIRHRS